MHGLFTIERVVLESLSRSPKNICELVNDTNITHDLLKKIICSLKRRNIILIQEGVHFLDSANEKKWIQDINNDESVESELNDLFKSIVGIYFDRDSSSADVPIFRVEKLWMDESEERIYNSLLCNLQSFIIGLRRDKKKKGEIGKTFQQRVAFWGHLPYQKIISKQLESI
jgi:hypothetical protein